MDSLADKIHDAVCLPCALDQRRFRALHPDAAPAVALDGWSITYTTPRVPHYDPYYLINFGHSTIAVVLRRDFEEYELQWDASNLVSDNRLIEQSREGHHSRRLADLLLRCVLATTLPEYSMIELARFNGQAEQTADYTRGDLKLLSSIQRKFGASLLGARNELQRLADAAVVDNAYMLDEPASQHDLGIEIEKGHATEDVSRHAAASERRDHDAGSSEAANEDAPPRATDAELRKAALDGALAELDALVGLEDVKGQVKRLVNLLRVSNRRAELGMEALAPSLHAALLGNPGTGKTTVARILGRIYYGLGLLKTDKFVEVTRGDLVGQYIGQSTAQTRKKIQEAMDGVLFIDEVYSLNGGGGRDYGGEVIAEIVAAMENHRGGDGKGTIAVIVAGYTKPTLAMIETNPGLKSRLSSKLTFADYSVDELSEIFSIMVSSEYYLSADAKQALAAAAKAMLDSKDEHFGNGREMRTLFEQSVMRQADRLAEQDIDSLDEKSLRIIRGADIVYDGAMRSKNALGFAA